ncbi:MAG: SpoIIE family protein phosphatase, partial [Clostridia bacterium]|nr:SpoIIE family protein phosphatase [Clostridia bacterium]
LVWSLDGVSVGIISLADVCSFLLIVNETKKKKCAYCAIMGLAVGLPSSITGAALYSLAGVVCFLLSNLSGTLGCIGAFTFLVMAEGYTGGYGALVSSLGGNSVGLTIALGMQKYSIGEKLGISWLGVIDMEEKQRKPTLSVGEASAHISDISDTFSSLSRMLRSLSVYSERSRVLDTRAIVESVCDEICTECKRRGVCYTQRASDTADMRQKLAHALSRGSSLTKEALPEHIQKDCIRIDRLVSGARAKMASAVEQTLSDSGCKLLASDYEAMSRILDSHLEKTKEKSTLDKALSSELYELCQRNRWGIGHISVWGKRIKRIYASDIDLTSHTASARQLSESFGRVCKTRLCSPVYSIDESEVELEMHSIPTLSARCSIACAAKEGERECGDSARSFLNREGYFYSVLCDGMGSGREAAYTSAISVEYIASMLEHSNPKELTVEMLNAVLRERSGECSSTLDLLELDTYTGEGCFIKSGAAPSFVCRSKNVYKIQARTIPIGITERIRAEKIKFKLREGDVVVMASDGVTEGSARTRRMIELLCARPSDEPLDIAAYLLSSIKDLSGAEDDMTVAVTVIEPYREE